MCGHSGRPAPATGSGLEKRSRSAGRGASSCVGIVVGLRQLPIVGSKSEVAAQVVVHVHVYIVVGSRATDTGPKERSGSAGRGACVGIVVGAFDTDSRHEIRSGSAGIGACVGIVVGAFDTDSRHEMRSGSAGIGAGVNSNSNCTNSNDTEANVAGRSARACDARKL